MRPAFLPLLALLFAPFLTGASYASDSICVAEKHRETGYASFLSYDVYCTDGTEFSTRRRVTTVILPLPYNWGKVAREDLYAELKKRGYSVPEYSRITPDQLAVAGIGTPESLLVFSKGPLTGRFASVVKSNDRPSGVQGRDPTFDASFKIQNEKRLASSDPANRFHGVTQAELAHEMNVRGFRPVLEFRSKVGYARVEIFLTK